MGSRPAAPPPRDRDAEPATKAGKPGMNGRLRRYCAELGPGLVTGCADDDPSGISTYSMAGAAAGYGLLWTALLSLPLMISVQMMCGRLGMVTGRGLAGVIRQRYSRWVLWGACLLLVTANVINIAADLGGMGQGAELVSGISALIWTPLFTVVIMGFMFWSSYRQIARIFKWLTLVLLAYVGTAFLAHVDWRAAVLATFLPHIAWSARIFLPAARHPGDDDIPLSVFLAGVAGSRGGASHGTKPGAAPGSNGRRITPPADRHDDGHVRLESHYVFHYPDDRRHSSYPRNH